MSKKSKQMEEINTFNPDEPSGPEEPYRERKMENHCIEYYKSCRNTSEFQFLKLFYLLQILHHPFLPSYQSRHQHPTQKQHSTQFHFAHLSSLEVLKFKFMYSRPSNIGGVFFSPIRASTIHWTWHDKRCYAY